MTRWKSIGILQAFSKIHKNNAIPAGKERGVARWPEIHVRQIRIVPSNPERNPAMPSFFPLPIPKWPEIAMHVDLGKC
jgi:hypothetical protein